MPDAPTCYCGAPTRLRESRYGHFYGCSRWPKCDGLVGTHPGTTKPLGDPADARTRTARHQVHKVFDPLWESEDGPSRGGAYHWLGHQLELEPDECHVGMFDLETCRAAYRLARDTEPEDVKAWLDEREAAGV